MRISRVLCLTLLGSAAVHAAGLPAAYYDLLDEGARQIRRRLAAEPGAGLAALEAAPGWRHFPSAVLIGAVLHHKRGSRDGLDLALRAGDLCAAEHEAGRYGTRLDHHRDTYMWLDAYRLLEKRLGEPRRARWRKALLDNLAPLEVEVARRQDYPRYQSPFIGTSPNHYSLWSSTLHLAGKVFGNAEWEKLGARVMHRFAAEEQTPDGYWGEHTDAGPTTNYDYLTAAGVALYYEHSGDPAALAALRRSTRFHQYFTYPDGQPVETVNDRNRYGYVSMWGHFGFSHFPDGRRYAEFLTSHYPAERLSLEGLGRIAQNALYFHEGPVEPMPLDQARFVHRMQVPAGVRKSGPWMVSLSGLIATQAPRSQFYLDRQAHLSVFHEKLGLIVTGANSKRQPELATFWERIGEEVFHLPMSSRLRMEEDAGSLALSYSSFFSVMDLRVGEGVSLRADITPRGRRAEAQLNLQLCLKAGETLEAGIGRVVLDGTPVDLPAAELRHHGWTIRADPAARLRWPVYPFNPYANGPEKGLERAVGVLSIPLQGAPHSISIAIEAQ